MHILSAEKTRMILEKRERVEDIKKAGREGQDKLID